MFISDLQVTIILYLKKIINCHLCYFTLYPKVSLLHVLIPIQNLMLIYPLNTTTALILPSRSQSTNDHLYYQKYIIVLLGNLHF